MPNFRRRGASLALLGLAAGLYLANSLRASYILQPVTPAAGNGQITLVVGPSDISSTGTKACSVIENSGTIKQADLIANALPTGANLVVDVLKVAFGSYTGFASASSITAAAVPTITTVAANPRYTDAVLMGWNTSVSAGDVVCVAINTAPTGGATSASLSLKFTIP